MKKIRFLGAALALITLFSCKKDEDNNNPPAAADKFMTLTAGSTWDYKFVDSSGSTPAVNLYTATATNQQTTKNSKTYTIFNSSAGDSLYYNITGNNYYTFQALPAVLIDTSIEVLYLKDNAAAGTAWSQSTPLNIDFSGTALSLTLTLNNKIAQKDISRAVHDSLYNHVIDVQTELSVANLSVAGIPIPNSITSDIHYYYAPKIGLIENKTVIDFIIRPPLTTPDTLHVNQKTELQSYHLL